MFWQAYSLLLHGCSERRRTHPKGASFHCRASTFPLKRWIRSTKARKKVPHHVSGNLKIDPHSFQTRLSFLIGTFERLQSAFDAIQKFPEHFYFTFVRAAAWRHEMVNFVLEQTGRKDGKM